MQLRTQCFSCGAVQFCDMARAPQAGNLAMLETLANSTGLRVTPGPGNAARPYFPDFNFCRIASLPSKNFFVFGLLANFSFSLPSASSNSFASFSLSA